MKIKPTESELAILQILWKHGPSTVREVNERLNEKRAKNSKEIGYTTTLKIMQLMAEKDKHLVVRDTSSRTHIYKAQVQEKDTKTSIMKDFINSTFSGSATKMVLQALGTQKPSQKELDEIKSLIDQLEKDK